LHRYDHRFPSFFPFYIEFFLANENDTATGLADDNLMSSMKLTPMSTLLNTVKEFCMDTSLTGVTAEVSGEKGTHRWPPEYVDEITKENMEMFVKLGYA
jgi:hypothetical protein